MIFAVFTALFLSAAPVWVIDNDNLQQKLPADVAPQDVTSILKAYGIEVSFEKESKPPLWQGKSVSIYLARETQTPFHLWVEARNSATLADASPETIQEVYQACWMARQALERVAGATNFMIFQTDAPRIGKHNLRWGFEILPALQKDQIDTVEKAHLNDYMLFGKSTQITSAPYTADQVAALKQTLVEAAGDYFSFAEARGSTDPMLTEPWCQNQLHVNQAANLLLGHLLEEFKHLGIVSSGKLPDLPFDDAVHRLKINADTCAFCNLAVIRKQLVAETPSLYLLHSHKPISSQGSFLLLPKRHKIAWELSSTEVAEAFRLLQTLTNTLKAKTGNAEVIVYVQDGPASGQTVPHTHFHCYAIPSSIKHDITGLQHMQNLRPVVPPDRLREICDVWAEELRKAM